MDQVRLNNALLALSDSVKSKASFDALMFCLDHEAVQQLALRGLVNCSVAFLDHGKYHFKWTSGMPFTPAGIVVLQTLELMRQQSNAPVGMPQSRWVSLSKYRQGF